MKNSFTLAVESSTASFISKKNLILGDATACVFENLAGKTTAILCFASGWYEVGFYLKEELLKNNAEHFCFTLEEEFGFEQTATKLLNSVCKLDNLVVIGSENLALFALSYSASRSLKVLYVPQDFCFCEYLTNLLQGDCNHLLTIDEKLLAKCGRNKLADGLRGVFAKRIIIAEMHANELIAGLSYNKQAENLINEGIKNVNLYLKNRKIEYLVIAILLSSVGEVFSGSANVCVSAGKLLEKMQNFSLKGEREYLLYKMVLRMYNLYFSNDTSFTLGLPGVVVEEQEANELLGEEAFNLSYLPAFFNDIEKTQEIKERILKEGKFLPVVKQLLASIEEENALLKREYGGRKYSVEHYSAKQRAKALLLAPYILNKPCAYSLLFASGITQYFK